MVLQRAFVLILTLIFACLGGCSGREERGKSRTSFPDTIVDSELLATVNSYPIRGRDLSIYMKLSPVPSEPDVSTRERNELLMDQLINSVLVWQEAVASGLSVDDSTVQAVLLKLVDGLGGEDAFARFLSEIGVGSDEFYRRIQRDLLINEFLKTQYEGKISVSEEEARSYYDARKGEFYTPDSVRARHILVMVRPDEDYAVKADKRRRIGEILEKARSGESFADLALLYSDDPSKFRKGDLGYFSRGSMVAPFDSVAFSLEVGEVSGVVETQYGYHIIKVEDKKMGRFLEYDEVRDSVIALIEANRMALSFQNHLKEIKNLAIIRKNY